MARRVSRKLSVSKGRLGEPTTCWTTMWICKSRELQTYPRITFSILPSLSLKHAAPAPFSRTLSCLRARSSTPGLASSVLVMDYWDSLGGGPLLQTAQALRVSTLESLVCASCQLKFPPGKHSHNTENAIPENRQACVKPVPGTPDVLCHIPGPSPLPGYACHTRAPPATSQLGSFLKA